jgi:bifunctional DNase/RNase
MPIYIDLDEIETIAEVEEAKTYQLSPLSHALIMSVMSHIVERWRFHRSGVSLTDEEWDEAEAMSDLAINELLTEV